MEAKLPVHGVMQFNCIFCVSVKKIQYISKTMAKINLPGNFWMKTLLFVAFPRIQGRDDSSLKKIAVG